MEIDGLSGGLSLALSFQFLLLIRTVLFVMLWLASEGSRELYVTV
jgi:hypothetical protein